MQESLEVSFSIVENLWKKKRTRFYPSEWYLAIFKFVPENRKYYTNKKTNIEIIII